MVAGIIIGTAVISLAIMTIGGIVLLVWDNEFILMLGVCLYALDILVAGVLFVVWCVIVYG